MGLTESVPETRFAKSGDVHIAYRVWGAGPFDVVIVPPLFFSMEVQGNEPRAVAAMERLGSLARVIQFDKGGTGSSDAVVGAPPLEARMDDVRAVMDATRSELAALVGVADGGAMSLLFAATYPQRTFALALFRVRPRYIRSDDYPWAPTREEYEETTRETLRVSLLPERERFELDRKERAGWGLDELSWDAFRERSRLSRLALSRGALLALRRMNMEIDVRHVLPAIQVPTLLMYRRPEDLARLQSPSPDAYETADAATARYMADVIPDAQLVEVSGGGAGVGWWYDVMLRPLIEFLPDAWSEWQRRQAEPQRVLATVLFTDLVGSTTKALEAGPRWQKALREHNAAIRREIRKFRGREIDTAGDGFFASGFDGPARAIRCACAIRDAVTSLGLGVRVGVHTGECDIVDDKLSGLAVNIGARVAAQAQEGEVLVSGTVKDLVAGSGIAFEPRGLRELKGLGEWPLYVVARSEEHPLT
jgi:class 3 adenylate cyclase/pimeloyl-ACP methyl ester carboxylesterase